MTPSGMKGWRAFASIAVLAAATFAQQPAAEVRAPPKPRQPSVLALGACSHGLLADIGRYRGRAVENHEHGILIDDAVDQAGAMPNAALAWTVALRFRDLGWTVQVVDVTRPHREVWLQIRDAIWIPTSPAPGEPPLSRDRVVAAALRAVLATDAPDKERPSMLVWLLTHSADREDRRQAAQDLAHLPEPTLAVHCLVGVFDLDPAIVGEAVVALGAMGAAAADALPELRRLADRGDANLCALVAMAIGQIEAAADKQRPSTLVWRLTHSGKCADRRRAAQDLAHLPDAHLAVRSLVSVFDRDPAIVSEAVVALGAMEAAAVEALPELRRLADHRDANLRAIAAMAIWQIETATGKK